MKGARLFIIKSDRYCLNCLLSEKNLIKWYKETYEKDGDFEVEDILKDLKDDMDWQVQEIWFDDIDVWDEDGKLNI